MSRARRVHCRLACWGPRTTLPALPTSTTLDPQSWFTVGPSAFNLCTRGPFKCSHAQTGRPTTDAGKGHRPTGSYTDMLCLPVFVLYLRVLPALSLPLWTDCFATAPGDFAPQQLHVPPPIRLPSECHSLSTDVATKQQSLHTGHVKGTTPSSYVPEGIGLCN